MTVVWLLVLLASGRVMASDANTMPGAFRQDLYQEGVAAQAAGDAVGAIKRLYAFYVVNDIFFSKHADMATAVREKITAAEQAITGDLAFYDAARQRYADTLYVQQGWLQPATAVGLGDVQQDIDRDFFNDGVVAFDLKSYLRSLCYLYAFHVASREEITHNKPLSQGVDARIDESEYKLRVAVDTVIRLKGNAVTASLMTTPEGAEPVITDEVPADWWDEYEGKRDGRVF